MLLPYSLSHTSLCDICILSFPQQGGPYCPFSLDIICVNNLDSQDGRNTLCFSLTTCLLKEGYVYYTLASESEHDLGVAVVLVLGAPCWNEKIPPIEIRHKLSSEVACSVPFYFFLFKKMFSNFPLVLTQDSLLSN